MTNLSKEEKALAKEQYKNDKKLAKKEYKLEKKEAKKQYKADLDFNEEIEISQFVCKELDKFNSDLFKHQVKVYSEIYNQGLDAIKSINIDEVKYELAQARALPKNNDDEKEFRKFKIEFAKKKISAKKAYDKYYGTVNIFVEPDMVALTSLFDKEDDIDKQIFELVELENLAKKQDDKDKVKELKAQVKQLQAEKKAVQKDAKALMDEFAKFNRAAKPYNDAKKILIQAENYSHFDEISALYDEAKINAEQEDKAKEEEMLAKKAEEEAELAKRKLNKNKK
jgi:hypothetical protein